MAIDWMSPAVLLKTQMIFNNFSHWAIGCYCLEWLLSLKFEWSVLTRRRPFRLPMLLYFYTKWSVLIAFIGMLIAFNVASPINCQALYSSNQYFGNTGIAASSTLLMLRTFAIWNQTKLVVIPLALLALGQWGIAFFALTTVKAHYDDTVGACVVGGVSDLDLDIIYLYTMFLDAVVLVMTTVGLLVTPGRSNLWRLLLSDGILFFAISFFANTLPAVLLLVNLNPVMNIIFSIPAVGASAAMACRSFVRLSDYAQPVEGSRSNNSNVQWTSTRVNKPPGLATIGTWGKKVDDPMMTVNVTTTQQINLDEYPANMHPLDSHNDASNDDVSGQSTDQKTLGPYAV